MFHVQCGNPVFWASHCLLMGQSHAIFIPGPRVDREANIIGLIKEKRNDRLTAGLETFCLEVTHETGSHFMAEVSHVATPEFNRVEVFILLQGEGPKATQPSLSVGLGDTEFSHWDGQKIFLTITDPTTHPPLCILAFCLELSCHLPATGPLSAAPGHPSASFLLKCPLEGLGE